MEKFDSLNKRIKEAIIKDYPDKTPVLGEGNINSRVLFIGEAPGKEESLQGRPFVGKAGKNLDEILIKTELIREQIYITNTVKFRPTKTSAKGTISNRTPNKKEVANMLPFLLEEIDIISPKIIVTLGNTPLKAIMGQEYNIGICHAQKLQYKNHVLFPLYHPAALIYNRELAEVFERDFFKLKELITLMV
ncbi:MAG: uracil-DNA glycosylase [Eubacteriales bacterium]|nr:uracil-DNA glycosylase [Eubacteriales bacterium]